MIGNDRNVTERRLIGLRTAADYLGITTRSVQRLVERGELKPVRLSSVRRTLFDLADLDRLVVAGR